MNRLPALSHIPQSAPATVPELRRILCAAPEHGTWGPLRVTVENVRAERNRAPETVDALLRANGRVYEFAMALLTGLAPAVPSLPLPDALVRETLIECRENAIQARVLAGDRSGPTLAALDAQMYAHITSLEAARVALRHEQQRRLAA